MRFLDWVRPSAFPRGLPLLILFVITMFNLAVAKFPFMPTDALMSDTHPAHANSVSTAYWDTLTASADSYVSQQQPGRNFRNNTTAEVRSWGSGRGKNSRTFAQFEVSTVPVGSEVLKAELTLCATSVPSSSRTYDVHRVTGSWTEGDITWTNQPGTIALPADSVSTPASPQCMTWSVAADVQAWVTGFTNDGLRVADSSEESSRRQTSVFRTREDGAVSAGQPSLYVVYRPCQDTTAPAPPAALAATPGDSQVALNWNDNPEQDFSGYNIYRSTIRGGPYSKINGGLVAASAYTDTGLTNEITYFYVVAAADTCSNESGTSNEDSTTPQAGPPSPLVGLGATPGYEQVALDWNDNQEPDLDGYNVYPAPPLAVFTQRLTVRW